ncbi:MAG: ribokinase [Verrucomicrobiales bacterium]|nr:ribokinase [Verrucomicrobiales bacterium]
MSDANRAAISVVGSLNIDYFTKVQTLPTPGETVSSRRLELFRGGKGANQAISACRQGAKVYFFGCVGEDEDGVAYRKALTDEGIDVSHLNRVSTKTGAAFITVDDSGENMIVIAPGANDRLDIDDIKAGRDVIAGSRAVLGQFETPLEALVEAATIANKENIPVVINPSPIKPEFPWHLIQTDYLIVNEGEAVEVLGFAPLSEGEATLRQRLHELRVEYLIVTRGSDDTLLFSRTGMSETIETLPVLPVDTVGAGDSFAGCFTARIAAGEKMEDAIRAANCAGALTTLGAGAQDPIPDYEKVDQHLDHLSSKS